MARGSPPPAPPKGRIIPPQGGSGTAPPQNVPPRPVALPVAAEPPPAFETCGQCRFWHELPNANAFGECRGDLPRHQLAVGPTGPVLGYGLTRSDLPRCRHGEPRA